MANTYIQSAREKRYKSKSIILRRRFLKPKNGHFCVTLSIMELIPKYLDSRDSKNVLKETKAYIKWLKKTYSEPPAEQWARRVWPVLTHPDCHYAILWMRSAVLKQRLPVLLGHDLFPVIFVFQPAIWLWLFVRVVLVVHKIQQGLHELDVL